MMMSTELSRIELTGLGGDSPGRPDSVANGYLRPGLVWLPTALMVGLAAWVGFSGYASKPAESETVGMAVVAPIPAPAAAAGSALVAFEAPTGDGEAIVPEEAAPVDRLKISSQNWRRGGLGSNALVTFTLRNNNDYAVKDIAISCVFSRRDGIHLTDRVRMLAETVNTRSRKTFARLHVGFVNINASKAKCSPVAARHV